MMAAIQLLPACLCDHEALSSTRTRARCTRLACAFVQWTGQAEALT